MPDGPGLVLRFGEQLDTQTVNGGPTDELTPEHAARYIAKYATKSAEDFGLGDRRITPEVLPLLDVPNHVDQLVRVAWQLGEHESYDGLRRWIHMIGFRGHFASKSRRYSTTLGAIRGERRTYRQRQAAEHARELLDEDTTLAFSHWEFTGVGYLTTGDAELALSAAARARERRQAARDAA
jgi:replication initiator protein RepSA